MNLPVTAGTGEDLLLHLFALPHPSTQEVRDILLFQVEHRLGADHPPIRNDADPPDRKPAPQPLDYRNERRYIRRVPRPHFAADRLTLIVQDDPHHHLIEVGAVILAVAQSADGLASFAFEVDGGGVEEDAIQTGKKITARQKQVLLDHILCAARGEGGAVFLVFEFLSQEGHRPVEMMQGQGIDAIDYVITMPAVTGAVGTGYEKPMQNRQKDRPLHVEAKLALCQKVANDFPDLQFFPQSLKDQRRTDLLGICPDVALPGEDQKNFFRKSGKGAHQILDLSLLLDLIHPADGGDDPLDGFPSFPVVLDDLEVVVLTGFFNSRKHGRLLN